MANRSTKILSRVFRNFGQYGVELSKYDDTEIYDEMQNGQAELLSRTHGERKFNITLATDTYVYPLSSDSSGLGKVNVSLVKAIITPSDWNYPFQIVPNDMFVSIKNQAENQLYDWATIWTNWGFGSSIPNVSVKQPLLGTIINGNLEVYPTPDSSYNGDVLEMWSYLAGSDYEISKTQEPELPGIWDKALEYYATAEFLTGEASVFFKKLFEAEYLKHKSLFLRKDSNMQRAGII